MNSLCQDCLNCRNCILSQNIELCDKCIKCINCKHCLLLLNCQNCINCENSKNCQNCIDCYDCYDCYDCINCENLTGKKGWINNKQPKEYETKKIPNTKNEGIKLTSYPTPLPQVINKEGIKPNPQVINKETFQPTPLPQQKKTEPQIINEDNCQCFNCKFKRQKTEIPKTQSNIEKNNEVFRKLLYTLFI